MNKKVLTIDDSKTLRMIIGKHLSPFGVEMIQAENGEQGIECAREKTPDVILLDYNMPVMDGYHTLVELKTDPNLKSIPVIMLTTETVKETVMKLVKLGLKDYISKPFTREILLDKLNPILELYDNDDTAPEQKSASSESSSRVATNISKPKIPVVDEKMTILAVDDKPNILVMLNNHLSDEYNVITANNRKTAYRAISQNNFDFLFMDLRMPDVSAFDVLDTYLKSGRNNAGAGRVAGMTLRTSQADIEKAMEFGISAFLYKPFKQDDAINIAGTVAARSNDARGNRSQFLSRNGDIRVLECPPLKSSKYHSVALALKSEIVGEINDMAEEGFDNLIIKVGDGFLSDMGVTRKFVDLVDHILKLSLNVRLVADSVQTKNTLMQFEETANIPTEMSFECALGSMQ